MTALAATARYELRMQLRKPAIWVATGLPFALWALFAVLGDDSTGLQRHLQETSPKVWMVDALGWFTPALPMVFGIVLADRLVRDRKLGVAELLDVTRPTAAPGWPASTWGPAPRPPFRSRWSTSASRRRSRSGASSPPRCGGGWRPSR
jgi:hypothetical protein